MKQVRMICFNNSIFNIAVVKSSTTSSKKSDNEISSREGHRANEITTLPIEIPEEIRKSFLDTRSYRYIRLQNKIKVLLVQDQASTTSAAACYVRSGSLNDPPDVNGIAHFCEHMLFLGTEKYPKENHYA